MLTELYRGLRIRLDSTQVEQEIKVLQSEGATVTRQEEIPAGAEKTFRTLQEVASVLETKLGEFVTVDHMQGDLYIPIDDFVTPWHLEEASMEVILAYLDKYDVKMVEEEKTVTLYEIKSME